MCDDTTQELDERLEIGRRRPGGTGRGAPPPPYAIGAERGGDEASGIELALDGPPRKDADAHRRLHQLDHRLRELDRRDLSRTHAGGCEDTPIDMTLIGFRIEEHAFAPQLRRLDRAAAGEAMLRRHDEQ